MDARRIVSSVVWVIVTAAACARPPVPRAPQPLTPDSLVADRLAFGRNVPDGGTVSETEWEQFLRDVVTPLFPEGLTVWRAEGQWRDAAGSVTREETFVLEVFHDGSARADSAMLAVAEAYKKRFRQEAVLRTTSRVRARILLP